MSLHRLIAAALALAVVAAPPVAQQREPVLKQINVPHDYYFREMYLPQVTTGPTSVTWSPDGRTLLISMNGSLWWRALRGPGAFMPITGGPGYDLQPDWDPKGARVAFVRYDRGAMELMLLDLDEKGKGVVRPITNNGAVNVEPRWSPDGTKLAFVTTQFDGRFNVAIMPIAPDGTPGPIQRITPEHASGLPRYYYSDYDQYLSPTWSPEGRELILISNRGHIWGAGTFWRLPIDHPEQMREIHDEETNWRARPDWATDGKRVVYSSYVGRQRTQLWLMTDNGGHPFQLTYGDFDATNARWSRDGSRIAYISNEGGNTSLWVLDLPGGKRTRIPTRVGYLGRWPVTTLDLAITDEHGAPTDARVSVVTEDGRSWAPRDALRHADDSYDRQERGFEIGYFHAAGHATVLLPAGRYTVLVTKGLEYTPVTRLVDGAKWATSTVSVRLQRLADLPAQGWYSGDLHVHMSYGGHYVVTPKELAFQARAEDLHVIEALIVNKENRIPDVGWFTGRPDAVSTARTVIQFGQEYHTSWWGHAGLIGLTDHILLPDYAGYTGTAAGSLVPMNADVIALAHEQGALGGYVHPFEGDVDPADTTAPLHNELPIDVALGLVDYIEVLGFSDHRGTADVWYKLLNCGFRLPTGAGTDAMTDYASLRGPVGLVRVFVRSGPGPIRHDRWLAALKAGKTFATNGPLLEMTVNGRPIGSDIALKAGTSTVTVNVRMRSIVPVDRVELVVNGRVVDSLPLGADHQSAAGTRTIQVSRSSWVTLRAWREHSHAPILDIYPFATTSPIYLTVDGRPQRSAADARYFLSWLTRTEEAAAANRDYNTPQEWEHVRVMIAKARGVFAQRLAEAEKAGE